jgi:hypothetical protein
MAPTIDSDHANVSSSTAPVRFINRIKVISGQQLSVLLGE